MTSANLVPRPDTLFSKTTSAAPTRALSPVRTRSPRMPSPRSSPAMRPQSPLSTRYEPSTRFEHLRPPSPRRGAVGNSQPRANTQSLRLPSLPRFHPANYPSSSSHHSSAETTPDATSDSSSPQPLLSPRAHHRMYSDAQKHLLAYQHDMISAAVRASSPAAERLDKPDSPKLVPLGSPGPVTPLELEAEDEGYLVAGIQSAAGKESAAAAQEVVEEMIRKEALRRGGGAASRSPKGR